MSDVDQRVAEPAGGGTASAETHAAEPEPGLLGRLSRSKPVLRSLGYGAAAYLVFVRATNRVTFEPRDPYTALAGDLPAIVTMWHGQHFMLPFLRRWGHDVRVMISRSNDGEVNAAAARALGLGTIRGSAARVWWQIAEKGGVPGFLAMRRALGEGATVCMTADLSKATARRAGMGVVALARASGRPIMGVSFLTSRRSRINSWDRAELNLPFGRGACVLSEPLYVAGDADEAGMEEARRKVEAMLGRVTARACALLGRRDE